MVLVLVQYLLVLNVNRNTLELLIFVSLYMLIKYMSLYNFTIMYKFSFLFYFYHIRLILEDW